MTRARRRLSDVLAVALTVAFAARAVAADRAPAIGQATLAEVQAATPEVSTHELAAIHAAGVVPVLDVRSAREYAIAHIPGAVNIWEKEVEQVLQRYPDRAAGLVLYCNGPYCGKSRRTAAELAKRGYTNVRRYQLGLPVWRALGRTVQTDMEGLSHVRETDRAVVLVDARAEGVGTPLPGAVRITRGEAEAANEDGPPSASRQGCPGDRRRGDGGGGARRRGGDRPQGVLEQQLLRPGRGHAHDGRPLIRIEGMARRAQGP